VIKKAFNQDKYSVYCREHLVDFRNALRDEASQALTSWPARVAAILLVGSSIINYSEAVSVENPLAIYTLFSYAVPIIIVLLYPILTMAISTIEKYSAIVMDLLCLSGILGFCLTLQIMFSGAESESELAEVILRVQGQTAFVLALGISFSFHSSFTVTFLRNSLFIAVAVAAFYWLNSEFLLLNVISVLEGYLLGTIMNWVFHNGSRTRFYLKSTDADTRQHLYNQLSKLVYSHQLERIKLGDELENTMPLKEGKAICNVFDVQKSGEIRHERTQDFFIGVFHSFLEICMKGYEHNPLRSRAFRLKETGDGFISTIGYPFLPIESRSLSDSAVSTALEMFSAFNEEVRKFDYSKPIKGAMGLAYNSIQGTFQSGGIRSYDLFGDAIIQAAKYEELRKQPMVKKLIQDHAKELGLKDFHIMIVQEVIYNSLSSEFRDLFVEVDLKGKDFAEQNFQVLYDNDSRYFYFHLLD